MLGKNSYNPFKLLSVLLLLWHKAFVSLHFETVLFDLFRWNSITSLITALYQTAIPGDRIGGHIARALCDLSIGE